MHSFYYITMEMNLRKSENRGSFSKEHKVTALISGLRTFISHICYLLTEAPDSYKKVPNAQEYAQMSTNRGCGSGGGNDNRNTEEQARNDAHREALRKNKDAERELIRNGSRPRKF